MSLRLALKALKSLGLTDVDAQVYVYLAKKGPNEEANIAYALNVTKSQLDPSLERLLTKGMVRTIHDRSIIYLAVPLEKILDDFARAASEEVEALQDSRKKFLSAWRSKDEKNPSNS